MHKRHNKIKVYIYCKLIVQEYILKMDKFSVLSDVPDLSNSIKCSIVSNIYPKVV